MISLPLFPQLSLPLSHMIVVAVQRICNQPFNFFSFIHLDCFLDIGALFGGVGLEAANWFTGQIVFVEALSCTSLITLVDS